MSGDDALARLIERDEPDAAQLAAALAALAADPALRARLREQRAIDELLAAALSPKRAGFAERVDRSIARLAGSDRFVRRVGSSARRGRVRRRGRGGALVAFAALAAAAAVAVALSHRRADEPSGLRVVAARHATLRGADGRTIAVGVGARIAAGDAIATGGDADAAFELAGEDGRTLRAGAATTLAVDDDARVRLDAGLLHVEVPHPPGPARERLRIATAATDVVVTGTRFSVSARDARTTVTMAEGSVRLDGRAGGALVAAPGWARATVGAAPRVEPPFPRRVVVEFHDPTVATAAGASLDIGDEYSAERGYGWLGPKDGPPLPGAFWSDLGERRQFHAGRVTTPRVDPGDEVGIAAGWADHVETWLMDVPDGRYRVTVRAGDSRSPQGPHHVRVQDAQVLDRVYTAAGEFAERSAVVVVDDGRLTMRVGGGGPGHDDTSDTILAKLVIERLP